MFIRIQNEHHPYFPEVWNLLQSAFHAGERRDLETLKRTLADEQMQLLVWEENHEFLGMAVCWDFKTFHFLEYLAVHTNARGKGTGTSMMQQLLTDQPLLLEVQPSTDDMNESRIRFYERLGLCLNGYSYYQPPYQKRGETFPLRIMSSPHLLTSEQFENYTTRVKQKVYEKWYL